MGFGLELRREARVDHARAAIGDEQARGTADHTQTPALGHGQQRRHSSHQFHVIAVGRDRAVQWRCGHRHSR
jgi:hypothetical protein